MKASIVIPTYNGAHKILTLLRSLETQSFKNFETIVVIDGSTDGTEATLKKQNLNLFDLKIIFQKNKGRASARNSGANNATGELIIFFDDDMLLEDNCVELHIQHHQNYAGSILCGTANLNIANSPADDFFQFRANMESKWYEPFENGTSKITLKNYSFTTQNLSVSKNVFNNLMQFDERLNDLEDYDFSMKAIQKDIPIYLNKSIVAWHCDYVDVWSYIKRQKEYLKAKKKLVNFDLSYRNLIPAGFIPEKPIGLSKILLASVTNKNIWNFLIRSALWKYLTPQRIKLIAYNFLIFSTIKISED